MNMKIYFLFILLSPFFYSFAQNETDIRNHYLDVNKRIQESIEHGFEGSLYCNEWVTNKNSKSWPAVGIYKETTSFWYDDDPNHLPAQERDPKMVLLKVVISRKSAALSTHEEFLYKNGRLVFYYSMEGEEGKQWETRIYFNTKGMFKTTVKKDGKELSLKELASPEFMELNPHLSIVIKQGKVYQDLFLKDMVYL